LAHEDLAGIDALATIDLHAQTLGLRIASVPRAAACFLVCHSELTLDDVVDADLGIRLPMSLGFLVVLAPAQLEDAHLVAAAVADDRRLDERARDERRADLDAVARAHEEHLVERNIGADFGSERLDAELRPGLDAILLAAGLDDCVHCCCPSSEKPGIIVESSTSCLRRMTS